MNTELKLDNNIVPVLIFDGDCGFCTTSSNYVSSHSSTPIRVEAWQLTDLTQYRLTPELASAKVQLYAGGELFAGHRAFSKILRLQKQWYWKALGWVLVFPIISLLSSFGYYLVARYRHKLHGGTPACQLNPNGRRG
jgi:predicted DCC family thiol-disulfide oxidoreductase YuxK